MPSKPTLHKPADSYPIHATTPLLEGMQKVAHQIGDEVLLLNPAAPSISWEKIDGVVAYHPESQETALILPDGMKCVSIIGASELFPSVVADEYQGMKDAVKYSS
jgi:DNA-binding LacI/PurR family transcriptional regulator